MKAYRTIPVVALVLILLMTMVSCTKAEEATVAVDAVSASTDYTQLVSSAVVVRLGSLRPTIEASGIIQSQYEVALRSRVAGTIRSVDFELGDRVEEGGILLRIDDTVASLSLSQVEKQADNSRKEVASNEKLYERGAISLNQLNLSKATLAGLEAQLARAKDSVRDTNIVSPLTGSVAEKSPSLVVGDAVTVGQSIAKIVDLQRLRIALSIGQSQIASVREGAEATISIGVGSGSVVTEGTVRAISASSDARTGSWTVLVDFENPDPTAIRAGLSSKVSIANAASPLHPLVPNTAIVNRQGKTYVYRFEAPSALLTEVTVLDRYGNYSAIEAVDRAVDLIGAQVLTTGLSRITEGSTVVTQYQSDQTE